jgi:hypothetical protein
MLINKQNNNFFRGFRINYDIKENDDFESEDIGEDTS